MKITLHQSYLDRDSVNQTLSINFLAIEIVTIVNRIVHHYNVCYQPFWLHYIIPYSHQLDPQSSCFQRQSTSKTPLPYDYWTLNYEMKMFVCKYV